MPRRQRQTAGHWQILNSFPSYPLGRRVLGSHFVWEDLFRYVVGEVGITIAGWIFLRWLRGSSIQIDPR